MNKWVFDRLREKSTWQGLALLAGSLGVAIDPEQLEAIAPVAVAAVGIIQAVTKDAPAEA